MVKMNGKVVFVCALLLTACGGGGQVPPRPTPAPLDTAVISAVNNLCEDDYTVRSDGSATLTEQGCPTAVTQGGTVPLSTASKLFSDLRAAQPLSALPQGPLGIDTALWITWQGQRTPSIIYASDSGSSIEVSLLSDADAVMASFH